MRWFLFLVITSGLVATASIAATRSHTSSPKTNHPGIGLGVILGEPTGFTGKYWFTSKRAMDFGIAFSFGNYVLFYADYLFQFPGAFRLNTGEKFFSDLVPYVGIGAVVLIATSSPGANRAYFGSRSGAVGLGIRVPLGVEWVPGEPPLGVFLEIAPGMGFFPGTYAFIEGGIGIRFYF